MPYESLDPPLMSVDPYSPITLHRWPGISKAPRSFISALVAGSRARGWDADGLLGHISSESGFIPDIKNAEGSSATGLIQVVDKTAQRLGFKNAAAIGKLGFNAQLQRVIFPYFDMLVPDGTQLKGEDFKLLGFGGVYTPDTPDNKVVFNNASDWKMVFDFDGDNTVTAGEIRTWFRNWQSDKKTFTFTPDKASAEKAIASAKESALPSSKALLLGLAGATGLFFLLRK